MDEPEFDRDGYPTEATLKRIEGWEVFGEPADEWPDRCEALMRFVQSAWHWGEDWCRRGTDGTWRVSTWSGNEDLIGALEGNKMFWMLYWQSSRRGGHYEFSRI
jgi:hypothetical protein